MKISIVGDIHLQEKNPKCRKDDYFHNILNKLEYILSNCDKSVWLGDVFSSHTISVYATNEIYNRLYKYKNKIVAIPGNHDVLFRNINYLNKTSLGFLNNIGLMDLKTESFELGGLKFGVVLVDTKLDNVSKDGDVLIGHCFYDNQLQPQESLTPENIKDLNYQLAFFGHDHKPYPIQTVGNTTIIRPGSLSRIDTQSYNQFRKPVYYLIETDDNGNIETVDEVSFPVLSPNEIYYEGSFDKEEDNIVQVDFKTIDEVISCFSSKVHYNSIVKILKDIKIDDISYNCIRYIHEDEDVAFV